MKRTWTIKLAFVCVLLSMMLVVSCGKKQVETDPAAGEETVETTDAADDTATDDVTIDDSAMASDEDTQTSDDADAVAMGRDDFENVDIYFAYDSSAIMDSEISKLDAKVEWLNANPDATIKIEGHCDERGTTEYNLALGDRRAERAKSFLVNSGVDASRISTISYGEEQPVALGHNEDAWSKNRRSHFIIE